MSMRRFVDQIEMTRDIERASVSRWFSSTDTGLVFFDEDEHGIMITQAEYDRWLDEALTVVDDYIRRFRRAPIELFVAVFVLMIGLGIVQSLVPLNAGPTRTLLTFAPLLGAGWPLLVLAQFRARQRALRRKFASKIRLRPRLDRRENEKTRRFNIVRLVQIVAGMGIFAVVGFEWWTSERGAEPTFTTERWPLVLGLVAVAWLAKFAADRIDGVHRRRLREWWRF